MYTYSQTIIVTILSMHVFTCTFRPLKGETEIDIPFFFRCQGGMWLQCHRYKIQEDIVVVRRNIQGDFIPFLIIELKPIIHSDLNGCHLTDVNESIIERYNLHRVSLFCALSDVQNWHVFDCNGSEIQTYYNFSNAKDYLLLYGYIQQLIQIKYK